MPGSSVVVALVAVAAAVVVAASSSAVDASSTIDRTFACKVGVKGGIRSLDVDAHTGYKSGDRFEWLAQLSLSTWKLGKKFPLSVAGVTAGWPPPPEFPRGGGLGFSTSLCKPHGGRVALTRRGLSGGPASAWGDTYRCFTAPTVFVRIRAQLPEAVTLGSENGWYGAVTRVVRGEVAVATPAGKPVAYGEIRETGKARLFTARSCR